MSGKAKTPVERVLELFGSYGLACVLLLFLFLLTFLGTIEQTDHGLFEVQKKYFDSLYLVYDLHGFPIPLPGVYLVLILLAANLFMGGIVRLVPRIAPGVRDPSGLLSAYVKSALRLVGFGGDPVTESELGLMRAFSNVIQPIGVFVIHLGMVLMLMAGLVKLKLSDDGNCLLFENQRSDEYQSYYEWELAVSNASQAANVQEWLIPEEDFSDLSGEATRVFDSSDLPFKLTLSRFARNGRAVPKGPMFVSPNPVIDGYTLLPSELLKEAEANVAGLYVHVTDNGKEDKQGLKKDGILSGLSQYPFAWSSGGKNWVLDLRKKRYRMPFTVVLDKFTHELHPRTGIAKVFMSDVTKIENGVEQKVKIQMNEPLRADGLVLFQASWGPENAKPGEALFSVFAVVRNPSDQWPLISCIVIGIGMVIVFSQKLVKYMLTQAAEKKKEMAAL